MKFVSISSVNSSINSILKNHNSYLKTVDFIVGISRGGLVPAAIIAARLNIPLATIYIDKSDKMYIDRAEWLKDKNILLIDDVCRTGKTLMLAKNKLTEEGVVAVTAATLFDVESYNQKMTRPEITRKIKEDVILPWDEDILHSNLLQRNSSAGVSSTSG